MGFLYFQVLKVWCLSCPREARAPSLPEISKENVSSKSSNMKWLYPNESLHKIFTFVSWWRACSYFIQKQKDPSKAHQLKLEVIVKALKWLEMDMDVDEVYALCLFLSLLFLFRQRLVDSSPLSLSSLLPVGCFTCLSILSYFCFLLQVECIMSILIYKNLMKGYFAHKSKVVVLSKQDPFPKLNGKPVNS